jgi:S1-C subfamily serine protease
LAGLLTFSAAQDPTQPPPPPEEIAALLGKNQRSSVIALEIWSTAPERTRLALQSACVIASPKPEEQWLLTISAVPPQGLSYQVRISHSLAETTPVAYDAATQLLLLSIPKTSLPSLPAPQEILPEVASRVFVLQGEAPLGQKADLGRYAMREAAPDGTTLLRLHAELQPTCFGSPVYSETQQWIGLIRGSVPRTGNEAFYMMPAARLATFLSDVRTYGKPLERWVGLKFSNQNLTTAILGVTPESPAAAAGFESGDVILEMHGKPILSFQDLADLHSTLPLDQQISVKVLRGQETKILPLTIRQRVRKYE